MIVKPWEQLPDQLRTEQAAPYYQKLRRKNGALAGKRLFDLVVSLLLTILLSPVLLALAIAVKADSPGPVFFRQERVTQYGRPFRIFKFRTMVAGADKMGASVTTHNDSRVTKVGHFLRKYRLDELPQLLNVLAGQMSFVGIRPEVPRYVEQYTPEMWATLLLPAGVTSMTSIRYKDEECLLERAENADETYVREILPQKMVYNLEYIRQYSFWGDFRVLFETVKAVFGT